MLDQSRPWGGNQSAVKSGADDLRQLSCEPGLENQAASFSSGSIPGGKIPRGPAMGYCRVSVPGEPVDTVCDASCGATWRNAVNGCSIVDHSDRDVTPAM